MPSRKNTSIKSRKSRKSRKSTPRKSRKIIKYSIGKKNNIINNFFDKITIINLQDKEKRWKDVIKGFIRNGIKFERYNAVDGRFTTIKENRDKKKLFELNYNVKIAKKLKAPEASLSIGTVDILRNMIKDKLSNILICEDDMYFIPSAIKKFTQGIEELPSDWDLLYLGCGKLCGCRGLSSNKTSKNKYLTGINEFLEDFDYFVQYKDDLRIIEENCEHISNHLSIATKPGGTWCYAFSRKGAKKFLKYIDNKITDHIDNMIIQAIKNGVLKAIAFDPPIVYHMGGAKRSDTSIPWDW